MFRCLFTTLAVSLALCLTCADRGFAQPASGDRETEGERAGGDRDEEASTDDEPTIDEDDFPEKPDDRLEEAEKAFDNAEYDLLRPLLEPTLAPESQFDDPQREQQARTLLGVGFYFEAQQVTDAEKRSELLEAAEDQFLELLRSDPDHELSPLIYPASVVELFDSVREEHKEELEEIRERSGSEEESEQIREGLSTVYIQREVEKRSLAVNFFPFGVGQFYNEEPVQGTAFAASQGLALGLNIFSYWMIESLRGPDGYYEPGPGNSADIARRWRTGQYVGLGLFAGIYAWSVVDALLDHRDGDVDVRTLDEPPPELGGGRSDSGMSLHIGLGGLGLTW
ncbi:MAG: hypothetical protein ACOCV2_03085 [Persicimonas sp.]